jgi:hypothetical protein
VQNVLSQQPIPFDENVVFSYLGGTKIRNIPQGTEAITNAYDGSLIPSETFIKASAIPTF